MCRLFFSINIPQTDARNYIEKFLYRGTVSDKMMDGYGFAWRRMHNKKWTVYKCPKPYFFDIKSPFIIQHASKQDIVIANIRNTKKSAAAPIASAAVSEKNTHPFYYKNHVFTHNGFIRDFGRHRKFLKTAILPKFGAKIRGETDTETMFFLYLSFLEETRDPERALRNMFGFFRRNAISGKFNILYSDAENGIVLAARYAIDEDLPYPLYIHENEREILIITSKILSTQKMMRPNEIIVFSTNVLRRGAI